MYRTKWIVIENATQKFEMTHYKELDGDKVVVVFYETNTGCGDLARPSVLTAEEANDLFKDLLETGFWKVTRNEYV